AEPMEHVSASPGLGDELKDAEVRECQTGGATNLFNQSDPALRVDEGSLLLPPACGRQHQVGQLRRLGRVIHVLHDKEIEATENVAALVLVDPRLGGIGTDHLQPANPTA